MDAYVLLYDGKFIKNPIRLQILTSLKLVFVPRKAMTLFLVYDREAKHDVSLDAPVGRILAAAIESFLSQKGNMSP